MVDDGEDNGCLEGNVDGAVVARVFEELGSNCVDLFVIVGLAEVDLGGRDTNHRTCILEQLELDDGLQRLLNEEPIAEYRILSEASSGRELGSLP